MDLTSIQLMQGAAGAAGGSTYVDDVFSNFLYEGNATTRDINNGIDLAGEGGLVWIKNRENGNQNHHLFDTTAPPQSSGNLYSYPLYSNSTGARGPSGNSLKSFNSNGFSVFTDSGVNENNKGIVSWSFRKAPGFFDVVTYSGAGGTQNISHNLGCIPGCIMIKSTTSGNSWRVYHRGTDSSSPQNYALCLNDSSAREDFTYWNDTAPTATQFTVADSDVNSNGQTYVAYIFAGGETTAATARSVVLDGTGDYLSAGSSTDFSFGTGDFTIEGWFRKDDLTQGGFWQVSTASGGLNAGAAPACAWTASSWQMYGGGDNTNSSPALVANQWFHVAQVRLSGVTTMYVNGQAVITRPDTTNYSGTHIAIGGYYSTSYLHEGEVSNFRVVKGTAVYTSSFRPPTEPLTNITNTKLLCCNNSSTTGSTVTPGTITANGNPTASTDSPFDDPEGFSFGEGGDQNIIKCGSYIGNGSATGPEINLGWEPQWILLKRTDSTDNWAMYDVMRGITTDGTDNQLRADQSAVEHTTGTTVDVTSTGFKITTSGSEVNANNGEYIFTAIRRPDGYCGKPPKLGTGAFALDVSNASSTIPTFDSGFPVDFALTRRPASAESWYTTSRLTGTKYLFTDTTAAEANSPLWEHDSNVGWAKGPLNTYQSWMWKRGAGFDVVTYDGNGVTGHTIPHSMNKAPEMMWMRDRNATNDGTWFVWHKGLNNGNPGTYFMRLNTTQNEGQYNLFYGAPTSTHFSLYNYDGINGNNVSHLAMLFASVNGISKVGSYTGTDADINLSFGFTPRLFIVKMADGSGAWHVFDTVRGITGSGAPRLELNSNGAQNTSAHYVEPYTNGIKIVESGAALTDSGKNYIYYAHA